METVPPVIEPIPEYGGATGKCDTADVISSSKEIPKDTFVGELVTKVEKKCESTSAECTMPPLTGFSFCHKHVLEDKGSPFKQCDFIMGPDKKHCSNPAPKIDGTKSYCMQHDETLKSKKESKTKKKNKKKKKPSAGKGNAHPSLTVGKKTAVKVAESSSEGEEYSFVTDSAQVDKTDCLWLGNQASDAESTDSEDENPLNHAGAWTLEECVRICKQKMCRLRFLYTQQYKRLNHFLRDERRKMLNEYDMDPYVVCKVQFERKTGDDFKDYLHDVHLTNYQRPSGAAEAIAEKQCKDKKSKGTSLNNRRSDLPRCNANKESGRCTNKVLPFSRYCCHHISNDTEQFLYVQCSHKTNQNVACANPCGIGATTCGKHVSLEDSTTLKAWSGLESAKKARENRKRKLEENQRKEKEVVQRSRRTSIRLKDDLKSPTDASPTRSEPTQVVPAVVKRSNGLTPVNSIDCYVDRDVTATLNELLEKITGGYNSQNESSDSIVDVVSEETMSSEEIIEYSR